MAFQAVPNTLEARLVYLRSSDFAAVNTIHVRDTVSVRNPTYFAAIEAGIYGWWNTNVKPLVCTPYTLDHITIHDLNAINGFSSDTSHGTSGTGAATPTVGIVAARVMVKGDPGALPRRGAWYQVGMSEANVDESQFTTAYCNSLEDAWSALPAAIYGAIATSALVIVSRYEGSSLVAGPHGQTLLKPTLRSPAITNTCGDFLVRQRVSKQSRRRPKVPLYVS